MRFLKTPTIGILCLTFYVTTNLLPKSRSLKALKDWAKKHEKENGYALNIVDIYLPRVVE